ncbi:adenylate/guanylate cyclase domain-containing protein [Streptomyces sp. HB2AG]|uniref:adenylate/guanylate cyclase domain-containing protein n=1 Tax=Streptomyces sp. HB2AG TaxID=2983400 RepID=UPI0022AB187D|nr:adenylate/guanylate cyclase domain-containing protein [Streptomyces sp. HB2AG]MCZ2526473.1 AAA family ATPase [Streptomyces sp. HB2AG]
MVCTSCARPTPAEASFCPHCGAPRTSPAGPGPGSVEERRMVTVVFCDLVGSTALSGRLDPEALRSVTLRYFALMRDRLEAHGGTVEKFIGDAVMAVFGVPVTHEDDARRALAAALQMVAALEELNEELTADLGVRLDVRIGVNTGEVVTGTDASARQALVSGEVVNVAARLEQNAAAGQVLVGPATVRAAGSAAVTEPVGPLLLKGKAEPVAARRLLAVRDDGPETLRRFDTPFVGRETELAELDLLLRRTLVQQASHLVTVYGEAGMGKTRLVREWLDRTRAREPVTEGTGRCRPYGDAGSLAPLADALRQALAAALPPGEDDAAARSEMRAALAVLESGLLRDGTPNPSLDDTCAALVDVLAVLAQERAVVLAVDDCHWASPVLFDVLDRLLEELEQAAVLVVCVARPELPDLRPGWGSGRLRSAALMLSGLSPEESALLAVGLDEVAAHRAGSALAVERAEGNPLHLEQLLSMMAEGEPGEACPADALPPTVHALIGARLDTLDRAERTALDLAAVLGREFHLDELADLTAAAAGAGAAGAADPASDRRGPRGGTAVPSVLRSLTRRRLVEPPRRALGGRAPFRFSSGLVQEVAYRRMAKRARAERHEQAALVLQRHGAENGTVGGHLERAHRYRAELGLADPHTDRLRLHACERLAAAGARALARADLTWAADLLERALALSRPGEPARAEAARRLGEARLAAGRAEQGRSLLRDALEAAESTGDAVNAAHARIALAVHDDRPGAVPAADAARTALPVFRAAGDDLGVARACLRLAQQHQLDGRHAAAGLLLEEALEHAVRADAEPERAAALGATGISLWRGPTPVPEAVARCRELLDAHGPGRRIVRVTLNCPLAVLLALDGQWEDASARLAEAERLAGELGYAEAAVFVPLFAASAASLTGRHHRARTLLLKAEEACHALGDAGLLGSISRDLTRLALDHGQPEAEPDERPEADGRALAPDGGLSCSESADLDGLRARTAASAGSTGPAAALADRAVASAAATDSPLVQAVAALDRAHVLAALGRPAEAAGSAAGAALLFDAKGYRAGAARARALRDRLLEEHPHADPPPADPPHGNPPHAAAPQKEGLTNR